MAETAAKTELAKGARITGADRQSLGAQLAERYQAGESIRALAADTGRSFGFIHGVIKESGVTLRGRGGATRRSSPVAAAATAETPVAEAHPPAGTDARKAATGKPAKKDSARKDPGKKDGDKKGDKKGASKKGDAKAAGGKKKGRS